MIVMMVKMEVDFVFYLEFFLGNLTPKPENLRFPTALLIIFLESVYSNIPHVVLVTKLKCFI